MRHRSLAAGVTPINKQTLYGNDSDGIHPVKTPILGNYFVPPPGESRPGSFGDFLKDVSPISSIHNGGICDFI